MQIRPSAKSETRTEREKSAHAQIKRAKYSNQYFHIYNQTHIYLYIYSVLKLRMKQSTFRSFRYTIFQSANDNNQEWK